MFLTNIAVYNKICTIILRNTRRKIYFEPMIIFILIVNDNKNAHNTNMVINPSLITFTNLKLNAN